MDKIRIQRNVKRIEVNDNGDMLEFDFDDLNLPYTNVISVFVPVF